MRTNKRGAIESPYSRLKRSMLHYFFRELFQIPAKRIDVWTWKPEHLRRNPDLEALRQRVIAAGQLGYDVVLASGVDSLQVLYQKKVPANFDDVNDKDLVGWLIE